MGELPSVCVQGAAAWPLVSCPLGGAPRAGWSACTPGIFFLIFIGPYGRWGVDAAALALHWQPNCSKPSRGSAGTAVVSLALGVHHLSISQTVQPKQICTGEMARHPAFQARDLRSASFLVSSFAYGNSYH